MIAASVPTAQGQWTVDPDRQNGGPRSYRTTPHFGSFAVRDWLGGEFHHTRPSTAWLINAWEGAFNSALNAKSNKV